MRFAINVAISGYANPAIRKAGLRIFTRCGIQVRFGRRRLRVMLNDVHETAVRVAQKEPMSRADNLLSHLAQECCEVAIRCTKAQMFGLLEVQPEQSLTNAERIAEELCDLYATVRELQVAGLLPVMHEGDREKRISAKRLKAGTFRGYSSKLGRLAAPMSELQGEVKPNV